MKKLALIVRRLRASWRDTILLFKQFGGALSIFTVAILASGLLYYKIGQQVGEPIDSLAEGFYLTLTLTFLQASRPFPHNPFLQAFYYIMPVIGIGTLAQGLTDFGYLLFNRRARSKEWEMAVASTFNKHNVLVGLGHLGYRVIQKLHEMDESVVVIELNPSADLVSTVQKMGVPVIQDDATRQAALEAANIRQARTIVLCTQNDSLNLQIAVKARNLNPNIQVVVRIFDDDFAESLQSQFNFTALSATSMAAPAFAAAAAGADITRPITVEGQSLTLARLKVGPDSRLKGKSVGDVEDHYDISVVLLRRASDPDVNPANARVLIEADVLAVLGSPEKISLLVHDNI